MQISLISVQRFAEIGCQSFIMRLKCFQMFTNLVQHASLAQLSKVGFFPPLTCTIENFQVISNGPLGQSSFGQANASKVCFALTVTAVSVASFFLQLYSFVKLSSQKNTKPGSYYLEVKEKRPGSNYLEVKKTIPALRIYFQNIQHKEIFI